MTNYTSKQLLPVYDKPMIYYPLSTLMIAGIKKILIISTAKHLNKFKKLLGDGSEIGINLNYRIQKKPRGIAESFVIAESFIGNNNVCLILWDNIFHGKFISKKLKEAINNLKLGKSTIFSKEVDNPNDFGVIQYDDKNKISKIVEKPQTYISNEVVTGLYFYTNKVCSISKKLVPSDRGELEITEVNNFFLDEKSLEVIKLESDFMWSDTGTFDTLVKTSNFIMNFQKTHNHKIGCIYDVASAFGHVDK